VNERIAAEASGKAEATNKAAWEKAFKDVEKNCATCKVEKD
jgi:hypothetical protein